MPVCALVRLLTACEGLRTKSPCKHTQRINLAGCTCPSSAAAIHERSEAASNGKHRKRLSVFQSDPDHALNGLRTVLLHLNDVGTRACRSRNERCSISSSGPLMSAKRCRR